jgi:transposase
MSMVIYVGLDVHLNSIAAVWGKAKQNPRMLVITPSEEGYRTLVDAVGHGEIWAVYEASSCGLEAYDRLRELGWKVSIVAPTHIAKSVHGKKRKTDLRDARRLWEILMAHGELGAEMAEIWIPGRQLQEEREVVRRRLKLSESSCRVKNGILSLLRMHRIKRPESFKTAWSRKHVTWLRSLAQDPHLGAHIRTVLESSVRELEFVEEEIRRLDEAVKALAETPTYQAAVEKMMEIPGVGTLTALTFLVELGDLRRFDNRRQVGSYMGLVPASYESGDANDRKGHITRLGPPRVRKVLNQAAWHLVRLDPLWRKRYEGIASRGGGKTAIVAIMRKLGIELWQRARSA